MYIAMSNPIRASCRLWSCYKTSLWFIQQICTSYLVQGHASLPRLNISPIQQSHIAIWFQDFWVYRVTQLWYLHWLMQLDFFFLPKWMQQIKLYYSCYLIYFQNLRLKMKTWKEYSQERGVKSVSCVCAFYVSMDCNFNILHHVCYRLRDTKKSRPALLCKLAMFFLHEMLTKVVWLIIK